MNPLKIVLTLIACSFQQKTFPAFTKWSTIMYKTIIRSSAGNNKKKAIKQLTAQKSRVVCYSIFCEFSAHFRSIRIMHPDSHLDIASILRLNSWYFRKSLTRNENLHIFRMKFDFCCVNFSIIGYMHSTIFHSRHVNRWSNNFILLRFVILRELNVYR